MKLSKRNIVIVLIVMTFLSIQALSTGCSGKHEKKSTISEEQITKGIPDTTKASEQTNDQKDATTQVKNEILKLTDDNFKEKTSEGIILVDFWATWCGPCRSQAPILEEVNTALAGKITIAKLDIDRNKQVTDQYGVMNIPTMLLFNDGKLVNKFVGLTQKDVLISAINKELN